MIKSFNKEKILILLKPEKYELKILEFDENIENPKERSCSQGSKGGKNKKKFSNDFLSYKKNAFIKIEDGFEEMSYFEDNTTLYIIKEMFNNFELINNEGLDLAIEEEKIITKDYTEKIINNLSKNNEELLEENEKKNLLNLFGKHHNRIIFLQKINDYRASCLFELREKDYNLLGELFLKIINSSKIENDYHCVEMVIIFSKTYYTLKDNKERIYILNLLLDNKIFQIKEFWEELLIYSISKEVSKSNKRETSVSKNENNFKTKNENIIFSQLLSLIDNMFDFELNPNLIKEIIEPKMIFYKIGDHLRDTINEVIVTKIKSKEEEKNKKSKAK